MDSPKDIGDFFIVKRVGSSLQNFTEEGQGGSVTNNAMVADFLDLHAFIHIGYLQNRSTCSGEDRASLLERLN